MWNVGLGESLEMSGNTDWTALHGALSHIPHPNPGGTIYATITNKERNRIDLAQNKTCFHPTEMNCDCDTGAEPN